MTGLEPGLRARVTAVVGDEDTAVSLGSGDVPVLGTPRLLALAEAATVEVVRPFLGEGRTSVGTRAELAHRAASPVGADVTVDAELRETDGRRLVFGFTATDGRGAVLGSGVIERVVVDRDAFVARAVR